MQRCLLLGRHADTENTPSSPSSHFLLDVMPDDPPAQLSPSSATPGPRQKQQRPSSSNVRSRTSPPPNDQDARPPTKRARKAINCEPCRNSKLKCDRSEPSPSPSVQSSPPPETDPAPAVSSEVHCSRPIIAPSCLTTHRYHCPLLPGCQGSRGRCTTTQ